MYEQETGESDIPNSYSLLVCRHYCGCFILLLFA